MGWSGFFFFAIVYGNSLICFGTVMTTALVLGFIGIVVAIGLVIVRYRYKTKLSESLEVRNEHESPEFPHCSLEWEDGNKISAYDFRFT